MEHARHLERMRVLANVSYRARVVSQNNFPMASGIASSASGFAALTVAGCAALGLDLSLTQLSALARRHVLVSFFHPVSAHAAARALRRVATGKKGDRHAVTLSRLVADAREAGLALVASDSLGRYRRDLWAAVFAVDPA